MSTISNTRPSNTFARIKICGLTRLEDIKAVNKIKPDYVGFVFVNNSPRYVGKDLKKLYENLDENITSVGVFAGWSLQQFSTMLKAWRGLGGIIEMIQLHGGEDENFIRSLKSETDLPIIKAVSVQKKGDAQQWENSAADYLLLDHKGGGTGETFDHNLIGELQKPFFLAGGLTPENVAAAIKKTAPFAVDVSSGVEISPGIKSNEKINTFTEIVRRTT